MPRPDAVVDEGGVAPRLADIVERVVSALSPNLLSPEWAARVGPGMHPTTGRCSVAAEAVDFLAGGPRAGLRAMVSREEDGDTHWWLEHVPTGVIVDPTAGQYTSVDFGRSPVRRSTAVIERVHASTAWPSAGTK